jgi:hypothetical protein
MTRFAPYLLLVLAAVTAFPAWADGHHDAEIRKALAGTDKIDDRATALARLAWGEDTASEGLAQRARVLLVESGRQGMGAITEALNWADRKRFADIMLAGIQAEQNFSSGDSPHTVPAIDRCIWFGPPDAKRLAMEYMTVRPVRILLLPVIDVAYEYPEMLPVVIDTLALMNDSRARFFLADQLQNGTPPIRRRAAEALATIGGRAREYLRAWALSDDPELRQVSFRALLPVSGAGDLTTLYEYMTLFPDDDPETLEALRARAQLIEEALARQEELEGEAPDIEE